MPRPLRINYSNAWYHVMNRGAGHKNIFESNYHRQIFLELLEECSSMFNLSVYAYCLMGNHYHLMVSTPDANLPRIMRHINGVYTQKYNRSMGTDGALFRGRYRAQIIEDDCYQLIVSRYIHLNPVDAGVVRNPLDYQWSSYRAYLGKVEAPSWLLKDVILNQLFNTTALSDIKSYQEYVEVRHINEINVYSSIKNVAPILGSALFREKILAEIDPVKAQSSSSDFKRIKIVPDITLIIKQVCLFFKISQEDLLKCQSGKRNWPKMVCIYICRKSFGHRLQEIASAFHLHRYEAVSAIVGKCNMLLLASPARKAELNELVDSIDNTVKASMPA